nr:hypothetical protein [Tanacetum cinerariifolium]
MSKLDELPTKFSALNAVTMSKLDELPTKFSALNA